MKYFTLDELTASATACRLHIDNTPDAAAIHSLTMLVDNLLDPVRLLWGAPVRVNSGYRSPALNRAVGGAANSHHLRGMAADITVGCNEDNGRLMELIAASGLKWTQLIAEKGLPGAPAWIHVSYDPADLRCRKLRLS